LTENSFGLKLSSKTETGINRDHAAFIHAMVISADHKVFYQSSLLSEVNRLFWVVQFAKGVVLADIALKFV
jgi:hypothetical protein